MTKDRKKQQRKNNDNYNNQTDIISTYSAGKKDKMTKDRKKDKKKAATTIRNILFPLIVLGRILMFVVIKLRLGGDLNV